MSESGEVDPRFARVCRNGIEIVEMVLRYFNQELIRKVDKVFELPATSGWTCTYLSLFDLL